MNCLSGYMVLVSLPEIMNIQESWELKIYKTSAIIARRLIIIDNQQIGTKTRTTIPVGLKYLSLIWTRYSN
jgi:hypothetical protein